MPSRFRITRSRREFLRCIHGETGSVTEVFRMEIPELFSGTVREPGRKITPELFPFFPGIPVPDSGRVPIRKKGPAEAVPLSDI